MLDMDKNSIWTMYISAIRYALGRHTYITSEAQDWTKAVKPHLTLSQRKQVYDEILAHLVYNYENEYDCDIAAWKETMLILIQDYPKGD